MIPLDVMSGGIHDGRVAIAEEWSFLVRVYGRETNIGRKKQIQRKMVLYCLLRFFGPEIRSGILLLWFVLPHVTAPPPPPRPPYHSPSENQYSAKVLVKRLWVGTLSRVIKVYQECIQNIVLTCIALYCHVQPCISMYTHVQPCNAMYSHVLHVKQVIHGYT